MLVSLTYFLGSELQLAMPSLATGPEMGLVHAQHGIVLSPFSSCCGMFSGLQKANKHTELRCSSRFRRGKLCVCVFAVWTAN